jgi:hypothetical protein
MFTKAGFRPTFRVLGRAQVAMLGGHFVEGSLVRWPGGETAWASHTRFVWPEQVVLAGEDRAELERLIGLAGGGQINRFTPSGKVLA